MNDPEQMYDNVQNRNLSPIHKNDPSSSSFVTSHRNASSISLNEMKLSSKNLKSQNQYLNKGYKIFHENADFYSIYQPAIDSKKKNIPVSNQHFMNLIFICKQRFYYANTS